MESEEYQPGNMSNAEKAVAEFLDDLNIYWKYEVAVTVLDEDGRTRLWYPDFLLPGFGIYVEVCGTERTKDYARRRKIYEENNYFVIFVHTYKSEKKWKKYLLSNILEVEKERQDILFTALLDKTLNI